MRNASIGLSAVTLLFIARPASAQDAFEPSTAADTPKDRALERTRKNHGVDLGLEFSSAQPVSSPETRGQGVAVDTRAGYRFAAGPLFFAPGVDLGYVDFPAFDGAVRGGVGGRVGANAGVVEPSVYAYGGGFLNIWKNGLGLRTGAALDVRAGRRFVPGLHVDYDAASWDTGSLRYVGVGAHVGFLL